MRTEILEFKDFDKIKEIVKNDGVVAFPTETVYGLGVRYDSFLAYKKIFEAKKRPENKTLTLMLYDKEDIADYAIIDKKIRKVIDFLMPGELTLVLPKKENIEIFGSDSSIGIRVPDNKETLELLKNVEIPLFVTSANLSGFPATNSFSEVNEQLNGRIEAIVKGDIKNKRPSTVASIIDGKITILREGPISLEKIKEVYDSE
ncbi:threonylcarbamoyl-AMP synthase [Erysipelotrichaceae bacterium OttesenSCG-928-M19]|nr:threonylcarbamoyl-AMP synthase [Erysipelotrichaceae bacterium OttesenSCG-928-M19]